MAKYARPIADALTVSRILLSIYLAWIGYSIGAAGLPTAVVVLLLAWFTDLIDGVLARRAPPVAADEKSWAGRHDAEADLSVSLGVLAYLVFSGYVSPLIGAPLAIVISFVWLRTSYVLAWPLYVIPYVLFWWIALQHAPTSAWLLLIYLGFLLFVRGRRLLHEHLPDFFSAIKNVWQSR